MDGDVDKIFGIRYENHVPWIGNQDITILNNDKIVVNGTVYEGTPGLMVVNYQHESKRVYVRRFDEL